MNLSTTARKKVNSTAANELPLQLLEIDHPSLITPARLVNDTQDITHNGSVFTALGFKLTLPDDLSQGTPRASLAVDNVGRELTDFIESSGGGKDATVRIILVLRSDPNTIEWEITLSLNNVNMNMLEVSGELGFEDMLNRPASTVTYTPRVAPGIF